MAVKGRGAKQKGTRAEKEITDIGNELGVPTQRVVASGAHKGAEGDIKVGVTLNADGTMPDRDESVSLMRGEVKNRKTHQDYIFVTFDQGAPEQPFKDLEQSPATKVLAWRRARVPNGAEKAKDYNRYWLMMMGATDFFNLIKRYQDLVEENGKLREALFKNALK